MRPGAWLVCAFLAIGAARCGAVSVAAGDEPTSEQCVTETSTVTEKPPPGGPASPSETVEKEAQANVEQPASPSGTMEEKPETSASPPPTTMTAAATEPSVTAAATAGGDFECITGGAASVGDASSLASTTSTTTTSAVKETETGPSNNKPTAPQSPAIPTSTDQSQVIPNEDGHAGNATSEAGSTSHDSEAQEAGNATSEAGSTSHDFEVAKNEAQEAAGHPSGQIPSGTATSEASHQWSITLSTMQRASNTSATSTPTTAISSISTTGVQVTQTGKGEAEPQLPSSPTVPATTDNSHLTVSGAGDLGLDTTDSSGYGTAMYRRNCTVQFVLVNGTKLMTACKYKCPSGGVPHVLNGTECMQRVRRSPRKNRKGGQICLRGVCTRGKCVYKSDDVPCPEPSARNDGGLVISY